MHPRRLPLNSIVRTLGTIVRILILLTLLLLSLEATGSSDNKIPDRFHGEWRLRTDNCGKPPDVHTVIIEAHRIYFKNQYFEIKNASAIGRTLSVTPTTTYSGANDLPDTFSFSAHKGRMGILINGKFVHYLFCFKQ